jgi:hypothetical protein
MHQVHDARRSASLRMGSKPANLCRPSGMPHIHASMAPHFTHVTTGPRLCYAPDPSLIPASGTSEPEMASADNCYLSESLGLTSGNGLNHLWQLECAWTCYVSLPGRFLPLSVPVLNRNGFRPEPQAVGVVAWWNVRAAGCVLLFARVGQQEGMDGHRHLPAQYDHGNLSQLGHAVLSAWPPLRPATLIIMIPPCLPSWKQYMACLSEMASRGHLQ